MNTGQRQILDLWREWIQAWKAIIDGIESGSARYYVNKGQGQVDITQMTLDDYRGKVKALEQLIGRATGQQ